MNIKELWDVMKRLNFLIICTGEEENIGQWTHQIFNKKHTEYQIGRRRKKASHDVVQLEH